MSVDKFGHFSSGNIRNVPKVLGIAFDRYNNLNIQNKKIKNLGPPTEDTDAVNKAYLQKQINYSREILKQDLNSDIIIIKQEIAQLRDILNKSFNDIHAIIINNNKTNKIITNS